MSYLNTANLIGNLGADPEIKKLDSGKKVGTFSVATTKVWKDGNDKRHESTQWHHVVVWEALADVAEKYLQKGKQVYVSGEIQYRSYEDKDGMKRFVTEIVCNNLMMLGKASDSRFETLLHNYQEQGTKSESSKVNSLINAKS